MQVIVNILKTIFYIFCGIIKMDPTGKVSNFVDYLPFYRRILKIDQNLTYFHWFNTSKFSDVQSYDMYFRDTFSIIFTISGIPCLKK